MRRKLMMTFPADLDSKVLERYGITESVLEGLVVPTDYDGRIDGILFKGEDTLKFRLDGRQSGYCTLQPEERAAMETGRLSAVQVAARCVSDRRARFTRNPVQRGLFD